MHTNEPMKQIGMTQSSKNFIVLFNDVNLTAAGNLLSFFSPLENENAPLPQAIKSSLQLMTLKILYGKRSSGSEY